MFSHIRIGNRRLCNWYRRWVLFIEYTADFNKNNQSRTVSAKKAKKA